MVSNPQCQSVIKTLLYAAQSNNKTCILVRELELQIKEYAYDADCCKAIGLYDAHDADLTKGQWSVL